jgi:hypothetical protein
LKQARPSVQSHASGTRDIEQCSILTIAEAVAPDGFESARLQPAFVEGEGEIAQFLLDEAQPSSGTFRRITMRSSKLVDFGGEPVGNIGGFIERREQAGNFVPTFKLTVVQRRCQNQPRRGKILSLATLLANQVAARILDASVDGDLALRWTVELPDEDLPCGRSQQPMTGSSHGLKGSNAVQAAYFPPNTGWLR